ncbi:DUF397 domain-containing protein [Kitasatospora kifunensis]|uniref:DUF397 domain-containing protein n=1 Tax=Kitasatospora kifunensis TaxID=58351 RepID=A0A7W7QX65_KITKI|nr:DUF397 domain-containing protein [Kitasatospora kifunensis]MBB4921460.1 hypothetical protein [Kitasatospora kifunensis]
MHDNLDQGAFNWHKSSRSAGQNECVEVGLCPAGADLSVAVRDTKDQKAGPVLAFSPRTWTTFVNGLKTDGLS